MTYTLTNAAGCDSIVTLHLTIKHSTTGTDVQTACNSYTWINGITYTSSNNTATYTLTNAAGCDSIVTLHLTIKHSTTGTDVQTACNSYTWINGITYTSSNNTATYTLTNAAGCDSIVTLHLTIKHSTTGTDVQTACNSYTWINGITYTSSNNTATYTLTNAAGCDSIVTLHLTINSVDNSVSVFDPIITSNTSSAAYQWLDCNNSFSIISGETGQSFTATTNGYYAVEITDNGCKDTSACVNVLTVGRDENKNDEIITIYPNPANSFITITSDRGKIDGIKLINALGQIIADINVTNGRMLYTMDLSQVTKGIYFVEITTDDNVVFNKKIIIHKE